MKKEYCVYVHTNKTNGKRYVGITSQKPKRRWQGGSSYKPNLHFYRAIKKYGWDGFDHEVLLFGLTKSQADSWERALIAQWNTTDENYGYNIGLGGEGHESFSARTRKKMSRSAKQRFKNPEEIQKNKERGRLQLSTREAIEAERERQIQYLKDHPEKRYVTARAVNQYDIDGRFMRQWKSIADARCELGDIGIGAVCNSSYGRKTAGGFMWRYADEVDGLKDIEPVVIEDCFRTVNQYNLDGVFIRQWKGLSVAEKTLNIKNVSEVCNGHRRQAAGYMWRFADLESRKQIEPYAESRYRGVLQFDKCGNYICEYKSIKEAGLITGISKSGIIGVCNGTNKTAGGYIWRYKDELQDETI